MKLMVLDGNSLINRAYHGVRPLSTSQGLQTNAIFGFLTTLQRLTDEEKPDALCVTFDRREPTFRHKADEAYKAKRKPMDEELAMQFPPLKDVLDAMAIPRYELAGYEADDLIGTISRRCEADGWDCVIVTGDKDSLQLITDHTRVKLATGMPGRESYKDMTPESFREAYGFDPIHMIDLKALMGDASDNISGVPGIGEKTAMTLIQTYGSIDAVYAHIDSVDLRAGMLAKLRDGEAAARHSYWMATIVTDAPLEFDPEDALRQPYRPELYDLFMKLEFTKLIKKYDLTPAAPTPEPAAPVHDEDYSVMIEVPQTDDDAARLLAQWRSVPHVTVYGLDDLRALAVECEIDDHHGLTVILRTDRFDGDWDALLRGLFSADIPKVAHNVKDMTYALLERGLPAEGFIFDTALAAYDLDATRGEYQLDDVFSQYCGAQIGYVDAQQVGQEAAREAALRAQAAAVAALYEVLPGRIREAGMEKLYYEIELPLCLCLARMETQGVLVDQMALIRFGNMLTGGIEHDQEEIFRYAGQEFNINSPKQLGEILFEKLELPPVKKTKSGYSTNAEVLEKLKNRHPIIEAILDYRTLTKLKSTYADGLVKEIAGDGRIHTTFQNMVTATGRLSSTEPNLQNIPVRTELGSEIRKMFVPQDGCVFVDADYSQIELRVLAHIAQDQHMQEAFTSGMDIHTATAAQVFHVAPEDVTPLMRRHAKAVNFGIVYGISEFSLAEDIGVTRKEAKAYIDRYLENYAGVRAYMKDIVAKAKQDGFVTTLFGRRRNLPELKSSNFNIRSFGERVALNTPIQGTAADIIKLAMLHVDRALRERKLQARLVLQVHDELIVECPVEERVQVTQLLTEQMQQVAKLSVPLLAEAKSGASWYEAK